MSKQHKYDDLFAPDDDPFWNAPPSSEPKRKQERKSFETKWVRLTRKWREVLRGASGATWDLAVYVLFEEHRRQHIGGEVILSTAATGLPHNTRKRATKTLVDSGLIEIEQVGRRAPRVTKVKGAES